MEGGGGGHELYCILLGIESAASAHYTRKLALGMTLKACVRDNAAGRDCDMVHDPLPEAQNGANRDEQAAAPVAGNTGMFVWRAKIECELRAVL